MTEWNVFSNYYRSKIALSSNRIRWNEIFLGVSRDDFFVFLHSSAIYNFLENYDSPTVGKGLRRPSTAVISTRWAKRKRTKMKKKERKKNSNCHTQSQLKQFKGARNRLKHKSSSSVSKRLLNNLAQCKGARASPFTAFMAQLRPKLKKNIPFKHQREKKIINFQFYYSLSDSLCSPWLDFQLCCFVRWWSEIIFWNSPVFAPSRLIPPLLFLVSHSPRISVPFANGKRFCFFFHQCFFFVKTIFGNRTLQFS